MNLMKITFTLLDFISFSFPNHLKESATRKNMNRHNLNFLLNNMLPKNETDLDS